MRRISDGIEDLFSSTTVGDTTKYEGYAAVRPSDEDAESKTMQIQTALDHHSVPIAVTRTGENRKIKHY